MNLNRFGPVSEWLARLHAFAIVASLVLLAAPLSAASDERQVYAGTVGAARVVMELEHVREAGSDDLTGRYFYRKYRLDIGLHGNQAGDVMTLESRTTGDRMTLRKTGAGLSGLLTTKDARRVAVRLSPLITNGPGKRGFQAGSDDLSRYEREQLADLGFVAGKLVKAGPRTAREWREPVSGIALFRIESGYSEPVLATINAALERHHWQQVSQWFTCEGYDGAPGMEISEARAPYLGDDHVSYAWFANWSCAGTAHPDFGTQGHTFDAHTGRELTLEDMLFLGDGPIPEADSPEFYRYRSEVFAPRIVAILGQLYPAEMKPDDGEPAEDRCDYADPSVWDFPSWYLTPEGLYLGAYFARVQRPCDEPDWSVIPWHNLTWRKRAPSAANH